MQKGMKKKSGKLVPNCVPAMKSGGLTKWFNEKWVDIGSKRKAEVLKNVEENLQVDQKENTPNACLPQKPPLHDRVAKAFCCCKKEK